MTAPDPAAPQHESHDDIRARLAALEEDRQASRDHRTRVGTLLTLAGGVAALVILGAVNVRDTTIATSAKLATIEARIAALESGASRRDTDDRGTREAIVRLQTTVETLQSTIAHRLDAIDQRLASPPSITPHR